MDGVLKGGRGYAPTPMGQVHYRLMAQGPGFRSLAVDTPGYGMSDAPTGMPTIGQYADNCFAARHPTRVTAVVLHNAPNYNPAERAQRLALSGTDCTLKPDGSHLSGYMASSTNCWDKARAIW